MIYIYIYYIINKFIIYIYNMEISKEEFYEKYGDISVKFNFYYHNNFVFCTDNEYYDCHKIRIQVFVTSKVLNY